MSYDPGYNSGKYHAPEPTAAMDRETTLFSAEPDGPAVIVYRDEVAALKCDVQLYGNVYVKTDEHGVAVRIDPAQVVPT